MNADQRSLDGLPAIGDVTPFARRRFELRRLAGALAVTALYALAFFALGGAHWVDRPAPYIYGAATGWALVAVASTVWLLRHPDFGPGRLAGRAAMVLPLLSFAWLLLLNLQFPQTFKICVGRPGLVCLDLTLAVGGVSVLVMMLLARRTFVARPLAFGAIAGCTAGAWTAVLMALSCECTNPSHIALGHVLPVTLLSVLGSVLAKRWINR